MAGQTEHTETHTHTLSLLGAMASSSSMKIIAGAFFSASSNAAREIHVGLYVHVQHTPVLYMYQCVCVCFCEYMCYCPSHSPEVYQSPQDDTTGAGASCQAHAVPPCFTSTTTAREAGLG